jgi:hypothetical protein
MPDLNTLTGRSSMNGISQYVQPVGVLTAVTHTDLIAQLTQYGGSESTCAEHAIEAYQI